MSILAEIMGFVGQFAITVISSLGYPGLFFLMALESMVFPLPAELVMPFAGYLASQGTFSIWFVLVASSLGSLAGSLASYFTGRYGGHALLRRIGRYLLLDEDDLLYVEQWFSTKGEKTIFIGRLIPVVRHLISIPAGMGRMNLTKFCLYTIAGATIWNMVLAMLGYVLGKNWQLVRNYTELLSVFVAVVLVCGVAYVVYRHIGRKRNATHKETGQPVAAKTGRQVRKATP